MANVPHDLRTLTGERLAQHGQSNHGHSARRDHGGDLVGDALVGREGLINSHLLFGTHHQRAAGAHRHTCLAGLEGGGCGRAANGDTGSAAASHRGSDPHVQGRGADGSHFCDVGDVSRVWKQDTVAGSKHSRRKDSNKQSSLLIGRKDPKMPRRIFNFGTQAVHGFVNTEVKRSTELWRRGGPCLKGRVGRSREKPMI
eukprot:6438440-Pyramimonas_sp.AAC.1